MIIYVSYYVKVHLFVLWSCPKHNIRHPLCARSNSLRWECRQEIGFSREGSNSSNSGEFTTLHGILFSSSELFDIHYPGSVSITISTVKSCCPYR